MRNRSRRRLSGNSADRPMYIHLTDAHCHANIAELPQQEAELQGMDVCVNACFTYEWESLKNFSAFPVAKSYGIHPNLHVSEFDDLDFVEREIFSAYIPELQQYLINADAIGETGFDARITARVPVELQRAIFQAHLELADKFKLPVIVHCVGLWGETFDILRKWAGVPKGLSEAERVRGIRERRFLIHAANCSPELVKELSKIGGYFSFGMRELAAKAGEKCAESVAADRLLTESDSSPSREISESAVKTLARIRNINDIELSEILYKNFENFYAK